MPNPAGSLSGPLPASLESPREALRRWAIVGLLCIAFIIAYIDRQNLSFALADRDFKSFFGLTDNTRGLLNSAFFWTYAALQIPAGWTVDRYGVKRPFAVGLAVWSILAGLTAWCGTFTQLFALRLLLGAGEAVNTPAGMRWLRLQLPPGKRTDSSWASIRLPPKQVPPSALR